MILSSLSRLRQPQNTISRATTALRGSRPWWIVVGPVSPLSLDAHISSGEIVSFFYWLWVGSSSSSNLWSWKSLRCTELTWSCNFMAYNCHFMLVIFFFWIWFSSRWLSVPNLIPSLHLAYLPFIFPNDFQLVSLYVCPQEHTVSLSVLGRVLSWDCALNQLCFLLSFFNIMLLRSVHVATCAASFLLPHSSFSVQCLIVGMVHTLLLCSCFVRPLHGLISGNPNECFLDPLVRGSLGICERTSLGYNRLRGRKAVSMGVSVLSFTKSHQIALQMNSQAMVPSALQKNVMLFHIPPTNDFIKIFLFIVLAIWWVKIIPQGCFCFHFSD